MWLYIVGAIVAFIVFVNVVSALSGGKHVYRHKETTVKRLENAQLNPVAAEQKDNAPCGRTLYLDLMKRAVANLLYEDMPLMWYGGTQGGHPKLMHGYDLDARIMGEDSPMQAHTMIGLRRLDNVQECIETAIKENIPGDIVETGVLRGGNCVFMRAVLKAHGVTDRKVYACDTFSSMPLDNSLITRFVILPTIRALASIPIRPWKRFLFDKVMAGQQSFPPCKQPTDDWIDLVLFHASNLESTRARATAYNMKDSHTSLNSVKTTFARYGLLDDQVVFLQGFFSDTLPTAPVKQIAVLRCDGDTFESTWDALTACYNKVSRGGFIIIDDYNSLSECRKAVDQFREENNITAKMTEIDRLAVYWQKAWLCHAGDERG